jgi:hypothetical protein
VEHQPRRKEARVETSDQGFEHLCDTMDLSPKSRQFLAAQSITDVSTLLDNADVLGRAALAEINKSTQRQLHKFCQWYEDFHK